MFAYSMREKTPAHRRYKCRFSRSTFSKKQTPHIIEFYNISFLLLTHCRDDVPLEVKKRRLNEVIDTFHAELNKRNSKELKKIHLVLVEGISRKSETELSGRSDSNKKIVFSEHQVPDFKTFQKLVHLQQQQQQQSIPFHSVSEVKEMEERCETSNNDSLTTSYTPQHLLKPGDYVLVEITETREGGVTLRGRALAKTTLTEYHNNLQFIRSLSLL
jgi:hypothetical protein